MGIFAKNNVPSNSKTPCMTCTSALVFIGYGKSEQTTVCTCVYPNIVVPFTVNTCSGYYDKNRPRKQLEGFKFKVDH